MGKILDLNVFARQTLAVKMPTGETIHLKKPTQAMTINMLSLVDVIKNIDIENGADEFVGVLGEATQQILCHNTEGKKYDGEYIDANINIIMMRAIFENYMQFMNEVQNQKN